LVEEDGEVIASAELAWENLKIAFLTDEELGGIELFEQKEWRAHPLKDVLAEPERFISMA
jgi:hypothetical protein